jgi:hypothetical protein
MVTQSREIGLMFTHRHWAAIFITPDKGSSTTNNYDDSRWGSPKSQPISGEKWVNMVSRNMSKYVDLDFEWLGLVLFEGTKKMLVGCWLILIGWKKTCWWDGKILCIQQLNLCGQTCYCCFDIRLNAWFFSFGCWFYRNTVVIIYRQFISMYHKVSPIWYVCFTTIDFDNRFCKQRQRKLMSCTSGKLT